MVVAITGILAVTTIVCVCILTGINGTVVASGTGIIGTIMGYVFGKVK